MKKFHNTFAGAFVDRAGTQRGDEEWINKAASDPASRYVPIWDDRCLAAGDPLRARLLGRDELGDLGNGQDNIFLGLFREQPTFALNIDAAEKPLQEFGEFHDLRYLGSMLSSDEANLVAHARALVTWHKTHRHCGFCGAVLRSHSAGNARICTSVNCAKQVFPRVDPAIIVLVSHGDHCLLGRKADWPDGRFSTIAGFVEPGESLEDAVKREVLEETNIQVGDVHYHSSQPWPFPQALMLGFHATAKSEAIELIDGELEEANWFTRKEIESGYPKLPYKLSIARRLIEDWLNEDCPTVQR